MAADAQLAANKQVYTRYVELINAQEFDRLPEVVDPDRYREICVGFTPDWVDLPNAVISMRKVLVGIPDLHARIDDCITEGDKVYARLTVMGTNDGRFFGVPPTHGHYEVNMFDYVRIADGRIIERVQQSDTFSQMRQIYTPAAKRLGLIAGLGLAGGLIAWAASRSWHA